MTGTEVERITAYLDAAAPPEGLTAHVIFGSRQAEPAELVAQRYHQGHAPMIILTGGANRRTGEVEARRHLDILRERGGPEHAVRVEDRSTTSWQNVEFALPSLREAAVNGLTLTAVVKWYLRRQVQLLRRFLPEVALFHAVTWNPVYGGVTVTRAGWPESDGGARRVRHDWHVIPQRLANGTLVEVSRVNGGWR